MEQNKRKPMDIADRAKQFMPFAALKGLPEALRKVEEEVEQEELNRTRGDMDTEYLEYLKNS